MAQRVEPLPQLGGLGPRLGQRLRGPAAVPADRQQHPDREDEQQHGDAQGDGCEQVLEVHSDRPYRAPLMSLRTRSQRSRIADSAPRLVGR